MKLEGIDKAGPPVPPALLGAPSGRPNDGNAPDPTSPKPGEETPNRPAKTIKRRKASGERKEHSMTVRFTEADYQVVNQAAAALGVSPSDYVRQAALRKPSEMLEDVILYFEARFDKIQSAPRPETK